MYFLILARGNQVHEYYQLPFILPAVAYLGKALDRYLIFGALKNPRSLAALRSGICVVCILGVCILSFLRYSTFMSRERFDTPLFRLASAVQEATQRSDLVISMSGGDPTDLYRCDRKGWILHSDHVDSAMIAVRKDLGAKYIIGEITMYDSDERKRTLHWLLEHYAVTVMREDYFVLKL